MLIVFWSQKWNSPLRIVENMEPVAISFIQCMFWNHTCPIKMVKNTWNWDKFETNEQRHSAKSVFFGSVPNALRWASERACNGRSIVDGACNERSIVSEQKSEWMSESEPMSVKWSEVAWYRARNHWCTKVESITPLTAQIKCRKMKQFHCRNLIYPMKYFIIFSSHAENIMYRQQTECQPVRQQRTGIVYVCISMYMDVSLSGTVNRTITTCINMVELWKSRKISKFTSIIKNNHNPFNGAATMENEIDCKCRHFNQFTLLPKLPIEPFIFGLSFVLILFLSFFSCVCVCVSFSLCLLHQSLYLIPLKNSFENYREFQVVGGFDAYTICANKTFQSIGTWLSILLVISCVYDVCDVIQSIEMVMNA